MLCIKYSGFIKFIHLESLLSRPAQLLVIAQLIGARDVLSARFNRRMSMKGTVSFLQAVKPAKTLQGLSVHLVITDLQGLTKESCLG